MTTTETVPALLDVEIVTPHPTREDRGTALAAAVAGSPVVLLDTDAALLVLPAQHATPDRIRFMVTATSGVLFVPMAERVAERLRLPPMSHAEPGSRLPSSTVSVDAAEGVSTGISARDRARTCSLLADPSATAGDFNRPGHILPIRVSITERGAAAAAVALTRLAGLEPVAVMAHLVSPGGRALADHHDIAGLGLPVVDVRALIP